jgi:hypothetical protein
MKHAMKRTRRAWINSAVLASLAAVGSSSVYAHASADTAAIQLNGSWHVTSAANSVILSIEPSGEALVVLVQQGAYSIARTKWSRTASGIVVEGPLRFRLWEDQRPDRLRAEIDLPEDLPDGLVSDGWRTFPRAFFMRRVEQDNRTLGPNRKLPVGWENATPPAGWEDRAGKRTP